MPYKDAILDAVARSGRSEREVSIAAVGHESAIRSLKREVDVRISTIEALCRELGLEFYVGPPREVSLPAETLAPQPHQRTGRRRFAAPIDFAASVQRAARELVRIAVGLGRNPIPEDLWPALAAHASETLPAGNKKVLEAAQPVTVIELENAAGQGDPELGDKFKGWVWFRRGWLEERGLNAEECIVIVYKGQSMAPTLPDGCSILVDQSSREWEPPRLLLLRTDEGLVVKRAAEGEAGVRIMRSDNPACADAPLPKGAEIIGRVRWVGCWID